MRRTIISYMVLALCHYASAQNQNVCVAEVIKYEEANSLRKDSSLSSKNISINYVVRTTNWENETVVSNVRFYRKGSDVHFYSEQGSIFMDEKEAVIVVPKQRMLVINDMSKELSDYRIPDRFFEVRRQFLDSCKVIQCSETSPGIKKVVLSTEGNFRDRGIHIMKMTYELDTKNKKVKSVKVEYDEDFGIKQLLVINGEVNVNSHYEFGSLRKKYAGRNGSIREEYRGYEVVDNRTKAQRNKGK